MSDGCCCLFVIDCFRFIVITTMLRIKWKYSDLFEQVMLAAICLIRLGGVPYREISELLHKNNMKLTLYIRKAILGVSKMYFFDRRRNSLWETLGFHYFLNFTYTKCNF